MKHDRKSLEGRPVYVVDGSRTPFLKARGKPGPLLASDLAVSAGRPLLARQPFKPEELDEVVFGCIMPTPDEVNIARVISLRIGCGKHVPAWTVQRNCGSGMQALDCAAFDICSGRADLVLAGGTEAMSHAPVLYGPEMVAWLGEYASARGTLNKLKVLARFRPGMLAPVIGILRGLTDPVVGLSMGQTAEILAHRFGLTREMLDDYAMHSHHRLVQAQEEARLGEIEVTYDWAGKVYDRDEGARADTTMASLAKLKPAFDRGVGKVTAGNSAQITDGAACLILASEEGLKRHGLQPIGRILDSEWAGLDPSQMGLGPIHAATPLMQRHNLKIPDIDYWEINEAFAAQVLACIAAWKEDDYCRTELGLAGAFGEIDRARLNVDGGGISLGHPVGTSGARIVLHLLRVLEHKQARRGVAALCIGGGQGGAMLLERT